MNPVTGVGAPGVDVGGPGVERHRTELEQQADPEQRHAGEQQAQALRPIADGIVDRRQGEGAANSRRAGRRRR